MMSQVLLHFVVRLAFGLSAAMLVTSTSQVTAGFFRVHLWVTLGLNTLAAMAMTSLTSEFSRTVAGAFYLVLAAAIVSYLGSVVWLYERRGWGQAALLLVCILDGVAAFRLAIPDSSSGQVDSGMLAVSGFQVLSASFLLGFGITAMLLGHWYLNTPSMQLAPLRRLLACLLAIVVLRGISEIGSLTTAATYDVPGNYLTMVFLRWLSGILGALVLTVLAWLTLRIPNTQSATGILYVVVIFVFLGELSSFWLATTYAIHS